MSAQRQLFALPPGKAFDPSDIKIEGAKLDSLLTYLEYTKLNISIEPIAGEIRTVSYAEKPVLMVTAIITPRPANEESQQGERQWWQRDQYA